jgi:hypothetical protein
MLSPARKYTRLIGLQVAIYCFRDRFSPAVVVNRASVSNFAPSKSW